MPNYAVHTVTADDNIANMLGTVFTDHRRMIGLLQHASNLLDQKNPGFVPDPTV